MKVGEENSVCHLCCGMRNVSYALCLWGSILSSFLPARAQFVPDKGVTLQQWKEPKWGFTRSYWLSDHELIYVQLATGQVGQYTKLDLTSGKEQVLEEFTKRVQATIAKNTIGFPSIYPSPDRKYLAWVATNHHYEETLVIATTDGTVISRQPSKTSIRYPDWSADSQWCYAFLEGEAPDEDFPEVNRRIFSSILAISVKTPSAKKTYPIALQPDMQTNALSGNSTLRLLNASPLLPSFHFGNENNIVLVSPMTNDLSKVDLSKVSSDIQWDEYNIADTVRPIQTHSMQVPALWEIKKLLISPQGDAIVWKVQKKGQVVEGKFLRDGDEELWISDQYGGNLKRLGKFPHEHRPRDLDYMEWLPSGKGISFLEEGELNVVFLNINKVSK